MKAATPKPSDDGIVARHQPISGGSDAPPNVACNNDEDDGEFDDLQQTLMGTTGCSCGCDGVQRNSRFKPLPRQQRRQHARSTMTNIPTPVQAEPDTFLFEEEGEHDSVLVNGEEFIETKVELAMDSGCGKHVTPPSMIEGYAVAPSTASQQGRHFIGAGGDRIKNHGQVEINLAHSDGTKVRSNFQVADVTRMLLSVSQICDNDCEVHFNKSRGWITDKHGKTAGTFQRRGGLYVTEMTLKNPRAHTRTPDAGFTRPEPKA